MTQEVAYQAVYYHRSHGLFRATKALQLLEGDTLIKIEQKDSLHFAVRIDQEVKMGIGFYYDIDLPSEHEFRCITLSLRDFRALVQDLTQDDSKAPFKRILGMLFHNFFVYGHFDFVPFQDTHTMRSLGTKEELVQVFDFYTPTEYLAFITTGEETQMPEPMRLRQGHLQQLAKEVPFIGQKFLLHPPIEEGFTCQIVSVIPPLLTKLVNQSRVSWDVLEEIPRVAGELALTMLHPS